MEVLIYILLIGIGLLAIYELVSFILRVRAIRKKNKKKSHKAVDSSIDSEVKKGE